MPVKTIVRTCIALVWLINGLYCKALGFVPRHEQIVARILGESQAPVITRLIGILEILMAVWIWSRIKPRLCAVAQAIVIAVMNIIEFALAPDLLLFGRINAIVALCFIAVILLNEFYAAPAKTDKS